jgi:pyruvate dehydrogenase E2 component (dihydrolipoamide acetyltransferase)
MHFFAKAMSICLHKYPDLNTVLIRNTLYYRKDVRLFFQTLFKQDSQYDLSGISIEAPPRLSLKELSQKIVDKTQDIRKKQDPEINRIKTILKDCPGFLSPILVKFFDFILYTTNLSLEKIGLPKDRMGSIMISNIGSLGIEQAYSPLFPTCRCPISVTFGKKHPHPFIINNAIEIKPAVTISFTADHRYFDGSHVAKAFKTIEKLFKNPELLLEWEDAQ